MSSRGDVAALALLLGLGSMSALTATTVALALASSLVRWGSPSLGAIAGAQAVLGPAGWTGSGLAVGSAWTAAAAVVLAARAPARAGWLAAVLWAAPFGVTAADLVIGPAPGGALALRAVASLVATVLATVLIRQRSSRTQDTRAWLGLAAALAAAVCSGVAR